LDKELREIKGRSGREMFSGGMFLGSVKNNHFLPSISLIDWLAKRSDRKIFVNKRTAWLFLCGRDLFGKGIVKSNVGEGLVLVQNENDENLGYGKIIDELNKMDSVVVENLLDKGDFLRREH
jgi:ribosome biogenesis protein Nip4